MHKVICLIIEQQHALIKKKFNALTRISQQFCELDKIQQKRISQAP